MISHYDFAQELSQLNLTAKELFGCEVAVEASVAAAWWADKLRTPQLPSDLASLVGGPAFYP